MGSGGVAQHILKLGTRWRCVFGLYTPGEWNPVPIGLEDIEVPSSRFTICGQQCIFWGVLILWAQQRGFSCMDYVTRTCSDISKDKFSEENMHINVTVLW